MIQTLSNVLKISRSRKHFSLFMVVNWIFDKNLLFLILRECVYSHECVKKLDCFLLVAISRCWGLLYPILFNCRQFHQILSESFLQIDTCIICSQSSMSINSGNVLSHLSFQPYKNMFTQLLFVKSFWQRNRQNRLLIHAYISVNKPTSTRNIISAIILLWQ